MKRRLFIGLVGLLALAGVAFAQLPGTFAPLLLSQSAAEAVSIVNTDNSVDLSGGTSFSFTSQSFGTASASRKVIVGTGTERSGAGAATVTAVTIGGVAASVVTGTATDNGSEAVSIWIAAVPTGTSGTIAITTANGAAEVGIGVWATYAVSATKTDSGTDSDSNPATFDLDIAANGVALGFVFHRSDTDPTTFTWANLTEDFDTTVAANTNYMSGASAYFVSAQTNLTISATASNNGVRSPLLAVASFPPL